MQKQNLKITAWKAVRLIGWPRDRGGNPHLSEWIEMADDGPPDEHKDGL